METAIQPVGTNAAAMRTAPKMPADDDGVRRLARALGWFSLGLGFAQVAIPASVARFAGAEPSPETIRLMRALGLREISSGIGILSGRRTDAWVRARVAGDVMDLALLGGVALSESSDRGKTIGSAIAVAGVTALDMLAAAKLTKARQRSTPQPRTAAMDAEANTRKVRRAITIARSPEDVAAFWNAHVSGDAPLSEQVRFVPAPGGRGTEVHLERTYDKPGPIARMIATLRHDDPGQYAFDELFALKQILETGDMVVSDAWINGAHDPHPAQPE